MAVNEGGALILGGLGACSVHEEVVTEAKALVRMRFHDVFIKPSWPIAALSRWTHISQGLKRVTLGCAMGRGLPIPPELCFDFLVQSAF